jgi:hypothetical protein
MSLLGKKYILFTVVIAFAVSCMFAYGCKKRDPLRGCVASFKGAQWKINDNPFVANGYWFKYDSTNNRMRLYVGDSLKQSFVYITMQAPLQNIDMPIIDKDSLGTAKATAVGATGNYFAKYGNIALEISTTGSIKTVCGQFFMQDGNAVNPFLLSNGEFRSIPIQFAPF